MSLLSSITPSGLFSRFSYPIEVCRQSYYSYSSLFPRANRPKTCSRNSIMWASSASRRALWGVLGGNSRTMATMRTLPKSTTSSRLIAKMPRIATSSSARPMVASLSTLGGRADSSQQDTVSSTTAVMGLVLASAIGYSTTTLMSPSACDAAEKDVKPKKKKQKKSKQKKAEDSSEDLTPSHVAKEDFSKLQEEFDYERLPIYTADQVSENNGQDGKPIWMTYGGIVYNVTNFIPNHPGGSEKILQAAGTAIEPYWYLYRQHFASDLPMKLMEHMAIGRLDENDQAAIDEAMTVLEEDDPYAREPMRHKALIVHSDTPMNAEVPAHLLTKSYLTPNSLFYIRHHHPVPFLTDAQRHDYKLKIDLTECGIDKVVELSLDDLKAMEKHEIIATLQCSGNRRSGFNTFQRTSGTPWGQGAISTAKFGGVRLTDVLKAAGVEDPIALTQGVNGMEHVQFHALDGMMASIDVQKAFNPFGDVIICYEMNGEPLPREHGYPLRVIVPGYAAVRNVKWLEKLVLSKKEAEGPWQRGLNYKTLPPSVTDAKNVDLKKMPSMTEVSLFSGITNIERVNSGPARPGDRVPIKVTGWAWSGGGRNIVRVDLSTDEGSTWVTANLLRGSEQKFGRAWAWTLWECDIPEAVVLEDGSIRVVSKAVDMAFNVQPEKSDHTWNVRGLGNNSWYRAKMNV